MYDEDYEEYDCYQDYDDSYDYERDTFYDLTEEELIENGGDIDNLLEYLGF